VILELGDEGADHGGAGVVGCRRSLPLDVIRLPIEFDALRQTKNKQQKNPSPVGSITF
jgi:hypothetical protein